MPNNEIRSGWGQAYVDLKEAINYNSVTLKRPPVVIVWATWLSISALAFPSSNVNHLLMVLSLRQSWSALLSIPLLNSPTLDLPPWLILLLNPTPIHPATQSNPLPHPTTQLHPLTHPPTHPSHSISGILFSPVLAEGEPSRLFGVTMNRTEHWHE